MKKLLSLTSIVILVFVVGCGNNDESNGDLGTDDENETIQLRIGTGNPDSHPVYEGLVKMQEVLEREAGDKFDVQIFPNHTVGDDSEMIEGLQMGTLDATLPSAGVVANFAPEFEVFNLPFLFPNEEVADEVLGGPAGQNVLDKLHEQTEGIIGLEFWEQGFFHITNNSHEIKTVDDIEDMKIRSIENEIQLDTLRALGANPTPMPFSEVFTGLQQGVIDGQQNPIANIYSNRLHEVQNYLTIANHHYGPSVFLVSETFWGNLSDEERELMEQAIKEGNEEAKGIMREQNMEQIQEVEEYGVTVTELEESELEKMHELVQPVIDKHSEEIGEELVESFYQAVENAQ